MTSIDFHAEANRTTYAQRNGDAGWAEAIRGILDPVDKRVADIGCAGGIYSRAWRALGAAYVVGVDFSAQMIAAARERSTGACSSRWPPARDPNHDQCLL